MNKKLKPTASTKYQTIHGWACHEKGKSLEPFDYKPAELLDGDVEIEISHCGICGSDIHTLDSGWGPTDYPVITGHEIVGTITCIGNSVTHLKVGDRVGVGAQSGACLDKDCFACKVHKESHCPKSVPTYNGNRPFDDAKSYGGYAEAVRVQGDFAFKIPESLPSEYAAPLLCAGTTVFSPMLRHQFKKGDRVGILGIGGLGHLAIKFANALGCEVVALSHSPKKKESSLEMGAKLFIDISDKEQVDSIKNTIQFLIVTANGDLNFKFYNSIMAIEGRIIFLTIPEKNLSVPPMSIIKKDISLSGSFIGSIKEIRTMLDFAAEHDIHPIIETFPMDKVNEGIQHVRDGKAHYRVVLKN